MPAASIIMIKEYPEDVPGKFLRNVGEYTRINGVVMFIDIAPRTSHSTDLWMMMIMLI
jgi:hypothetical protein